MTHLAHGEGSKIAFVVWTPFHYFVYRDIARHLPYSDFVVCPTWYRSPTEASAHLAHTTNFLEQRGVRHRQLAELYEDATVRAFFAPYDVIVATHPWPPLESHFTNTDWFLKKKTVRALYGTMKGLATFAPWTARFDVALAWGEYSQSFLSSLTHAYTVGDYKFDAWFNGTIDARERSVIANLLNSRRKTVLYMPTHGGLSSLGTYADAVNGLADRYNVLIKFHHHSELTERETVARVRSRADAHTHIFGEETDPLVLLSHTDMVISDSSSAAGETLLTGLPLVFLENRNPEQIRRHRAGTEFNGYWYSGGLVHEEGVIKELKAILDTEKAVVRSPDELSETVTRVLEEWEASPAWIRLRDRLFAFQDGKSGERAAGVIMDLARRKDKPAPPLLGAAARAYLTSLSRNYGMEIERLRKRIAALESGRKELNKK